MVKNIMNTSKQIVFEYRQILFPFFLLLSVLEIWKSIGMQLGILGVLIMFGLIAISHAEVVVGLKLTGQKEEPLDVKKDAYCGIYRIKELFSTYLLLEIIVMVVLIAVIYLCISLAFNESTASFWQQIIQQMQGDLKYGVSATAEAVISWLVLFTTVVDLITGYIVDCLFFLAPYYLEVKGVKGFKALRLALHNAKGHWDEIFSLQTRYYVMIVFFSCLNYLAMMYISSILLSLIVSMGLLVLEIKVFRMEYAISKALLFKEIEKHGCVN